MLTAAAEAADNGALPSDAEARHAPGPAPTEDGDKTGGTAGRQLSTAMLLRELVFCTALALTTYGALHTSGGKVWWAAGAVRFFADDSPVADWHRGQLQRALAEVGRADVSLVMYYAPWDAECQHVRGEFDRAARLMGDQVYFTAINCWNPGSECRLQHNKIPSWPVIMAYTVNSKGVLYRGPRDTSSMVKFLELIMRPLKRVSSVGDLVNLVAVCDAVAVAFTPLATTFRHYNAWYAAALAWRQHDPLGEVCLAAVTSERVAAELGVHGSPRLRYMLWNDTPEYSKAEEAWSEEALTAWLVQHTSQPAARLSPAWQKAFSFQRFVDGPVLMLFTPLNPLHEQLPSYDLLREVAMEYHDCAGSEWTQEIVRLQQLQRALYRQRDVLARCGERRARGRGERAARRVLSRYAQAPWQNATGRKREGLFGMLMKDDLLKVVTGGGKEDMVFITPAEQCDGAFPEDGHEQCEAQRGQMHRLEDFEIFQTSMLSDEDDPLSAARLLERHAEHACRLARLAAAHAHPHPRRDADHASVRGLACRSNSTLKMVALDSMRDHHFAESLGIDLDQREDKTAVVILDSKLESQYVLSAPYGEASLRQFILDYSSGRLKRTLRSLVPGARFTHYYGSAGARGEGARVAELTGGTFGRVAAGGGGEVDVVLICGGACPSHVTRSALSAARLLAHHEVRVTVSRLDALRHDLPWQYTAEVYPAVLVFPPDRRLESASYPAGERVSTAGLVALVMHSLGPPAKLQIQLAMCDNAAASEAKRKCLRDMRRDVTALIGRTLKFWRRTRSLRVRSSLFTRLQHLRQVSLDLHLLHVSHATIDNVKQSALLDSLSSLARTWDLRIPVLEKADTSQSTS